MKKKFERVTNSDMKKYHQQELIEFYEKEFRLPAKSGCSGAVFFRQQIF